MSSPSGVQVTRRDIKRLSQIALGYVATALWPQRWDRGLTGWRSARFSRRRHAEIVRVAEAMTQLLGPASSGRDLLEAARDYYRMRMETAWGRFRELHRSGWTPEVRVEGVEHLRESLSAGKGAVLWGMLFCDSTVAKGGLWRAGIRISHLGRETHLATSHSRVGLRVVAPIEWKAETRYLERRIVIPFDDSLGYMRELRGVLQANGCVSITGELQGRQNVTVEFFDGLEEFATGAPGLAWKAGCGLLTYFTVRDSPLRYRVVIEPAMTIERGRDRQEFVKAAVEEFARRLQRNIAEHPSSWDRWRLAAHEQQIRLLRRELTRLLPPGTHFILVDDNKFGCRFASNLRSIPFLERDGEYWGPPANDHTAIQELERLRQSGATFLVVAWPAFWWLDHYTRFHQHLSEKYRRYADGRRAILFDLRGRTI